MPGYPSATDLSTRTLRYPARQLTSRRQKSGTWCRRLTAGRQAPLALAHLRCGDTCARLAAGFGTGPATVYRHVREAVDVLAVLAPTLDEARVTARSKAYVILDGTVLPINRTAADRPCCSGKKRHHGMNVQVLTDPSGRLLWASPALPGAAHDLTAAREHGIIGALVDAGPKCWSDQAYQGAARNVRVPFKGRRLKRWQRRHNTTHAKIRCVGEQAMAARKGWRLLRKLRCSTHRITAIVEAVLALHLAAASG